MMRIIQINYGVIPIRVMLILQYQNPYKDEYQNPYEIILKTTITINFKSIEEN